MNLQKAILACPSGHIKGNTLAMHDRGSNVVTGEHRVVVDSSRASFQTYYMMRGSREVVSNQEEFQEAYSEENKSDASQNG